MSTEYPTYHRCGNDSCGAALSWHGPRTIAEVAKPSGWTQIPSAGIHLRTSGSFQALKKTVDGLLEGQWSDRGLQTVACSADTSVWIMGSSGAVEAIRSHAQQVVESMGWALSEAPPPRAGDWVCGLACLARSVARQTEEAETFVDGGSARGRARLAANEFSHPKHDEARERELHCSREGCSMLCRIAAAHSTGEAFLRAVQANGWLIAPTGRTYCGRTCLMIERSIPDQAPVEPISSVMSLAAARAARETKGRRGR